MSEATRHFDQLFASNNDPWAYRHSWYERRKRALTLAVLTRPRYASVFEPGCANGELSADLASRCDRLLCCDAAGAAVNLAKVRLLGFPHARVEHSRLPEQWPAGPFDLIVLSELCYYLCYHIFYLRFAFGKGFAALWIALASFVVRLPMSQPQLRNILTTFGVTAAASGTRMKMKDLWMAYANASCVARPILESVEHF